MKTSVCLNMIVKNESQAICRCLASIKPWIDTWIITDTGSSDGTQEIIRDFMQDVPGELIEVPWVDFAYNRNKALDLARSKAEYSLFMDADQQFIPNDDFQGFWVDKECYSIQVKEPSLFGSVSNAYFLLRNSAPIFWKGVLHEHLIGPNGEDLDGKLFSGGSILSLTDDGGRSKDPQKYLKDAWVLEEALQKEPDNARYTFYLGQSYMNAGENALALKAFEKRSTMGGTDLGELFFSYFMAGLLQERLQMDPDICLETFFKAHRFKESRHEPVYKIGQIYMQKREFQKAYDILKNHVFVYDLEDQYCIQADIRNYLLPLLYACVAYELKKYEECYLTVKKVSKISSLPEHLAKHIKNDLAFIKAQIPYLE